MTYYLFMIGLHCFFLGALYFLCGLSMSRQQARWPFLLLGYFFLAIEVIVILNYYALFVR